MVATHFSREFVLQDVFGAVSSRDACCTPDPRYACARAPKSTRRWYEKKNVAVRGNFEEPLPAGEVAPYIVETPFFLHGDYSVPSPVLTSFNAFRLPFASAVRTLFCRSMHPCFKRSLSKRCCRVPGTLLCCLVCVVVQHGRRPRA